MAVIQISKIQVRRGLQENLPQLAMEHYQKALLRKVIQRYLLLVLISYKLFNLMYFMVKNLDTLVKPGQVGSVMLFVPCKTNLMSK